MSWPALALAAIGAGLGAVALTRLALSYLTRRQILDHPNHRSSHALPTPRGGGLGVVPPVLLVWFLASAGLEAPTLRAWVVPAAALALMAASWADDRKGLAAAPRLLIHAAAVAAALAVLPADRLVLGGWLPLWADRAAAFLGWLWFVNLYNFMDGIDGITGIQTASLGAGVALVAVLAGTVPDAVAPALACGAAGLGFLVWNWHPARIFLGDVGSIPLGFLLGALLVDLAASGHLAAALILPGYYVADATITLGRRAIRGEKVWQAHRQHFYQRAVAAGIGHDRVALAVLAGNAGLVGAAIWAAAGSPAEAALLAVAIVAGLLALLSSWAHGR